MKKKFLIITVLTLLSLLGLIFFQLLRIKSAKEIKEQQLSENISRATAESAEKLMLEDNILPNTKKNDLLFPDKRPLDFFKHSVLQRFSKDEINDIIQNSLYKHLMHDVPFEFAIVQNTLMGEEIQSENFFKYGSNANSFLSIYGVISLCMARGAKNVIPK